MQTNTHQNYEERLTLRDLDSFQDLEWERQLMEEGRRPANRAKRRPVNVSSKIEEYLHTYL